ncbi:hypothetical protein Hdeb2414_s0121g00803231 [Helianthus debilis subsp. tardiflorus]
MLLVFCVGDLDYDHQIVVARIVDPAIAFFTDRLAFFIILCSASTRFMRVVFILFALGLHEFKIPFHQFNVTNISDLHFIVVITIETALYSHFVPCIILYHLLESTIFFNNFIECNQINGLTVQECR